MLKKFKEEWLKKQCIFNFKITTVAIISALLIACSHQPLEKIQNSSAFSEWDVQLIPQASSDILKRMSGPGKFYFQMGVIPGYIYGNPLDEPKYYIDMFRSMSPSIEMSVFENEVSKYAESPNSGFSNSVLSYEPENTRLVRISTYGVDTVDGRYFGGGFLDADGNQVALVYFDRACRIEGIVHYDGETPWEHDITIPEAGIYRLVIVQEKEIARITAHDSLEPLYVHFF